MMANKKLAQLSENDIWIFTKQSVSFDNAFKSVQLFNDMPDKVNDIPDKDSVNIEGYFKENFETYDIHTGRHRVLVIAQMYGLLTKTPPYKRGGNYGKEQVTAMFGLLNACEFGSHEYNKLKSEQLLKVKIRAIIDTASNNDKCCILPVIFSYKVLKTLKDECNINNVSLDSFYTYVMTCSDYSEVEEAVEYIENSSPVSNHIDKFKDRSRFIPLVQDNIKLFNVTRDQISINDNFDDYFNKQFMDKFDIDELNIQLSRDVDYTYFLTSIQDFNVNLIDLIDSDEHIPENQPPKSTPKLRKKKVVEVENGVLEDDDSDYVDKVDDVKEYNINVDIAKYAYKDKPSAATSGVLKRYSKNPIIGKVAVKKATYQCENDPVHETFMSSRTKHQFMEAHHLIPINLQDEMWDKYDVNVDCTENIISLCPNCHRAIHYAIKDSKRDLAIKLYNIKKDELAKIGVVMTLDELLDIYGVK